jgi:hypothetical protein
MNCNLVSANKYFSSDPPLKHRIENGTAINVSVIVSRIGNLNEMTMTFKARFSLRLSWFDWRVEFANLKNTSDNYNYLIKNQPKSIWLPKLVFSNCIQETNLMFDDFSSIIILRRGNPLPNSMIETLENEIFDGAENPFVYNRTYELEFNCGFNLQNYPFDYQNCKINVSAIGWESFKYNYVLG